MAEAATLEDQLVALLNKHDLSSLCITAYAPRGNDAGPWFDVSARGGDVAAFSELSAGNSIAPRIVSAIDSLSAKRARAAALDELFALDSELLELGA